HHKALIDRQRLYDVWSHFPDRKRVNVFLHGMPLLCCEHAVVLSHKDSIILSNKQISIVIFLPREALLHENCGFC
ncbi:MAG: hypothetical protein UDK36_05810, partial [Bacteroidaceae bacterium]|nr:hypothetical protein [Bacteroidaceae bacterium]